MKAFSDFLRTKLLEQTLGSGAYVVPHLIKVGIEDDETVYTVTLNGVEYDYDAVTDDTDVEILDGLQSMLDVSGEPVETDRVLDADGEEALRVRQDGTFQNYVLSVDTDGVGELSATQQVYAALFTDNPSSFGLGGEVDKNGYERALVPFGSVSNGLAESDEDLTFGPADEDWGTVLYVGLLDQFDGGNLLYFGEIETPRDIEENDKLELLSGNLRVNIG